LVARVIAALGLGSAVKHTPTLFFCAVMLTSWFGGAWPGIFSALLSAIALDFFFIPPIYALGISLEEAPDMIAFVASACFVSWLSRNHKQAKDSLKEARDKLDAKVCEGTSGLRRIRDQTQVATGRRGTAEEGVQAHGELSHLARTRTNSEPAVLIAPEPSEKTAEAGRPVNGQTLAPEKRVTASSGGPREFLPHPSILCSREESLFLRQGDYWTILYRGQIAHLKSTRGLNCLASLLGNPGREFHVSELIAPVVEMPVAVAGLASGTSREDWSHMHTVSLHDADPVLDARAKAEYARRFSELRGELEEAKQMNDPERVRKARQEMDCIADQLAVAVGLGGRDRKAMSHAERARSAVTKRIKDGIHKIAEAMPSLGRDLGRTIKTGYFCSYNPDPDCPVGWEVRS
jgi:hypothetical protein